MKKKTQRTVSILVILLMLLLLPVQAFAEEYDLANGSITVTADSSGQSVSQGGGPGVLQTTPTVIYQTGGATANTIEIEAEAGQTAEVTLKDVNIDRSGTFNAAALLTDGDGNVNIELDGDNTLQSGHHRAGLEKNNAGTLTIGDESGAAGSLEASGGVAAAGIGGGRYGDGSNITITGGTVTASGGDSGAGIGGGDESDGSNITITGGTVTANGGLSAAGIGGGWDGDGSGITINGGTVTANGGRLGAAIGGGGGGDGSNIGINGGTVTATGGEDAAGIGGGRSGDGSNIEISGGTVTANGGWLGAAIGGGSGGDGSNIGISGGEVTASGGKGGAAVGGGHSGDGSNIEISGGTVTASGGESGAGIGGGSRGDGSNIEISGGTVTANGGAGAAGIGGGRSVHSVHNAPGGDGSNIKISGGTVTASGGEGYFVGKVSGAGIGGGLFGDGSNIEISGGTVTANGGPSGAGIGGGCHGIGSDVTVSGYAQVRAQGGEAGPNDGVGAGIGNGGYCDFADTSSDGDEIEPDVSNLTTAGWVKYYAPGANMNTDEPIRVIIGKVQAYRIGERVIINGTTWIVAGIEGDVLELVSKESFTEEQLKDLEALIKNLLTEAQLEKLVTDKTTGERVFLADDDIAKEYFGGEKGHIVIRANKSILG